MERCLSVTLVLVLAVLVEALVDCHIRQPRKLALERVYTIRKKILMHLIYIIAYVKNYISDTNMKKLSKKNVNEYVLIY